jgi:hypothetical protein
MPAVEDWLAAGSRLGDRLRVHFDDDVRCANCLEHLGELLTRRTEPENDDMVLQLGRLFRWPCAAAQPGEPCRYERVKLFRRPGGSCLQERRQDHGQHGGCEKELVELGVQKTQFEPWLCQDEGKLTDLRQRHASEYGHPKGITEDETDAPSDGRLDKDQADEPGEKRQRVGERPDIKQHADRDEEQAAEGIPEWHDLAQYLVAIL